VKRVLARVCGIAGYPGDKSVADALWRAAESLLPRDSIEAYTQGLMDLGATVCLRVRPVCGICPAARACVALRERRVAELPTPRPRKARPHRSTVMLLFQHGAAVLLEKRPAPGLWGGLWCLPELAVASDDLEARYGVRIGASEALPDVDHGFTHFDLTISPRRVHVTAVQPRAAEAPQRWFTPDDLDHAGIPAPVRRIIDRVRASTSGLS
jgi:A/G-specific adenine glycosylase